jgi:chromosome segregation ATPase
MTDAATELGRGDEALLPESPETALVEEEDGEDLAEKEAAEMRAALQGAGSSPEALLDITRRAMSQGNVADAKVLALQLAANMARLEVEHSEAQVQAAEAQLEEDMRAVEAASEEVTKAEKNVQDAEWLLGEREGEHQKILERVGVLRDETADIENTIKGLDEQILQLTAQRESEAGRLAQAQAQLDEGLAEEGKTQTEMDELAQSGQNAREAFDAAQQNVERREAQRSEHEQAISEERKELEQRQNSAAGIEETIRAITGGPGTGSGVDEDSLP